MSIIEVDARAHPNLSGVERPFFDYWSRNILRPDDPHNQRWIDYEETAVARAEDRNNLIQSVVPIKGARVLDVGCQNGAWLVALGRAGAIPTGMDVDAAGIEAARIGANAYGIDARVEIASACEMPFVTGEFDIVASSDVLEHVPDKTAMLHECVRVLRPGGLLFLIAPIRFSIKHLLSDPHYGHPGLSVLPGSWARWASKKVYGESEYEVETLPTKWWTVRKLRAFGMEVLEVDEAFAGQRIPAPAALGGLFDEFRQAFTIIARKARPALGDGKPTIEAPADAIPSS